MLEYSEYKDVVEILSRSNHDSSYQDLMKKEDKVLDTVNAIVKSHRDKQTENIEFLNRALSENVARFWLDMNLMLKELFDIKSFAEIPKIVTKGDRVIYIGILVIMFSVILFFIEISK